MSYIFTSESVSGGHPDKVCDQISDAILDAYLAEDPNSRVACETMIKNNMVFIAGEITSLGSPDLEPIVRKTINEIGYTLMSMALMGILVNLLILFLNNLLIYLKALLRVRVKTLSKELVTKD